MRNDDKDIAINFGNEVGNVSQSNSNNSRGNFSDTALYHVKTSHYDKMYESFEKNKSKEEYISEVEGIFEMEEDIINENSSSNFMSLKNEQSSAKVENRECEKLVPHNKFSRLKKSVEDMKIEDKEYERLMKHEKDEQCKERQKLKTFREIRDKRSEDEEIPVRIKHNSYSSDFKRKEGFTIASLTRSYPEKEKNRIPDNRFQQRIVSETKFQPIGRG